MSGSRLSSVVVFESFLLILEYIFSCSGLTFTRHTFHFELNGGAVTALLVLGVEHDLSLIFFTNGIEFDADVVQLLVLAILAHSEMNMIGVLERLLVVHYRNLNKFVIHSIVRVVP